MQIEYPCAAQLGAVAGNNASRMHVIHDAAGIALRTASSEKLYVWA